MVYSLDPREIIFWWTEIKSYFLFQAEYSSRLIFLNFSLFASCWHLENLIVWNETWCYHKPFIRYSLLYCCIARVNFQNYIHLARVCSSWSKSHLNSKIHSSKAWFLFLVYLYATKKLNLKRVIQIYFHGSNPPIHRNTQVLLISLLLMSEIDNSTTFQCSVYNLANFPC